MLRKIIDLDLFGTPIFAEEVKVDEQGKKKRPTPKAHGYAAPPGTGPKGHFCRDCEFKVSVCGGARDFLKCELGKAKWTHGPGSDIKAKSPACAMWQQGEKKEK